MWTKIVRERSWFYVLIIFAAFVFQGCFNNNDDAYNANDYFESDVAAIEEYIVNNNLDVQLDTLSTIYYRVHKQGSGYQAIRGTKVDLHYRGETLDGKVFANTFEGSPRSIYLGLTQNNPAANPSNYTWGLDEWLYFNHKEGDSLTVFLPSAYGFQDQAYQNVPPNTPIMYHVKFEDITLLSEDLEKIDQFINSKNWISEIDPKYGTRYVVHEAGDPDVTIDYGDNISIQYQGSFFDESVFDSNFDGQPWNFTLGQTDLIPGFEMGLVQLNDKDSASFFVPSIYGYGEDGRGDIPGNTVLVFDVSVRNVTKNN